MYLPVLSYEVVISECAWLTRVLLQLAPYKAKLLRSHALVNIPGYNSLKDSYKTHWATAMRDNPHTVLGDVSTHTQVTVPMCVCLHIINVCVDAEGVRW